MEMTIDQKRAIAMASARMRMSQQSGQATSQTANEGPTQEQRDMTSAPMRFLKGMQDPITGITQVVNNALPTSIQKAGDDFNNWLADFGFPFDRAPEGGFDEQIANREKEYQEARSAVGQTGLDAARLAGNVATTIPATMIAPGATAATLPMRAAQGAALGGAVGATTPVFENTDDFWTEKAKQVGVGAAAGAIATPVAEGVARVIKPQTDKAVSSLMGQGVTPAPGQILGGFSKTVEEKARSVPILGDMITAGHRRAVVDFNRAAYNRALEPIGIDASKFPVGRAGLESVKNALGREYDKVLPKLNFRADTEFASDIQNLRSMVSTLPDDVVKQFDAVLRRSVVGKMTQAGTMSGVTLKQVESELGRIAKGYRGDASFDKRQLGDAIFELQQSIRNVLVRANPESASTLQAINKGYANYAILRKAGSMANTGEMFTPSQLASAVKAMDKSVGKGATATGTARMQDLSDAGVQSLASKYPDSGTAGRLFAGGGVLAYDPAVAAGLAVSGIPYTPIGQKAIAALLTKRPESFAAAANAVRAAAPAIGAASAPGFLE